MDSRIWNIIGNYVKGEATSEEADKVKEWLAENPEHQNILDEAQRVWKKTGEVEVLEKVDIDDEWASFTQYRNERLAKDGVDPVKNDQSNHINIFPSWVYRAAAVLVIGAGFLYYFNSYQNNENEITNLITQSSNGEKLKIELPDKSEVWLNKFSSISYKEGFGISHRKLTLKGEAFFDVQKNTQPFVILGNKSKTEVLGTAFNIKNHESAEKTEIVVVRGKVAFSETESPENRVTLEAGEMAILEQSTKKISKTINSNNNFLAWKDNILIFDRTKFSEIISIIKEQYDITVSLENNQLNNCHFTGKFNQSQLKEVFEVLAASMDFNYSIKNQQVIISGEGCPN